MAQAKGRSQRWNPHGTREAGGAPSPGRPGPGPVRRPGPRGRSAAILALGALALSGLGADLRGAVVLEDAVDLQILGREIVALLPRGGALRERLQQDEEIVFSGARGRVGLVITTRRALAASPRAAGFQEVARRRAEARDWVPSIGSRLALVAGRQRSLVFDGLLGRWLELDLGPHERPTEARLGDGVAVVITPRRALGVAPGGGRFVETPLRIGEDVEQLSVLADLASLRTSQRLLVFRAESAVWEIELRTLY